jgi:Lon protease-like protein
VVVTRIPLFPLRSVLCPGVALPLHIFEDRYRLMIGRCIQRGEPFGVVLIREGREVGPLDGSIAAIGTTAAIRQAGRYPDGRYEILTVGQQRFQLESVDADSEPYLVGQVSFLEEAMGAEQEVRRRAEQVGKRFLEYLQLLQPAGDEEGPEIQIEFEVEVEEPERLDEALLADGPAPMVLGMTPDGVPGADAWESHDLLGGLGRGLDELAAGDAVLPAGDAVLPAGDAVLPAGDDELVLSTGDATELSPEERRELLLTAARRLLSTDDPTALSYVLTALIQVELSTRQALLEAPTTMDRLLELERILSREAWLLRQGLRPIIIDAASLGRRAG